MESPKLTDKIAYITFWINIFHVPLVLIGIPLLIIFYPNSISSITSPTLTNPFHVVFIFGQVAVVYHWGYCVWFLFKFDRYSASVFPLFLLNVVYSPIYYYRVLIKKRPLRNRIGHK